MTRKTTPGSARWFWLLLLPLPSMVGYAGSGDPLGTMTDISNHARKGDRLPLAGADETAWISCARAGRPPRSLTCAAVAAGD